MDRSKLNHELIRASAGTGKTYQLTNRYLQLLRAAQPPDEILATTFTRKAAGEILERILLRLAEAATEEKKLAELRTALDDPRLSRQQCLDMLVHAARNLHRLRVGTLDAFFAQIAGSFSLELGLPPGWRIAEAHEDAGLRAQAVDTLLDSESTADLLTLVHALTRGETTRSLQREVRDKVDSLYAVYRESDAEAWQRVPRSRLLSDDEIHEAVERLRSIPLPAHKSWHTSHAKDVAAAELGDWSSFISGGVAGKVAAGENTYYGKTIEPVVAEAYQTLIGQAKAVHLNQLADQTEATYRMLDKFHAHYEQLKSRFRALRFDDVTFRLAQAGGAVRAEDAAFRLDARLHHLLLDEFQDTSLAQWAVLRPYAQRVTVGPGRRTGPEVSNPATAGQGPVGPPGPTSFFCVGDVKQAIYGWRGGVAEIFDAAKEELAGIDEQPLDKSWRSAPAVIHAVNDIFQNIGRHNLGDLADAVARWQAQFNTHTTARTELNGYVCLQAATAAEKDEGESQKEITLRFAAEQVARWRTQAPDFAIGVLVRRNDAVRRIIFELRELGIEASEEGGSSLDDSAAVRLVLSLVQLADHPGDRVARFHLATSPLAAALELSDATDEAAAGRLAQRIRRQLLDDGYGPTVYALAQQLAPACNRRELRRLEKLIHLAYQYEPSASLRPRDFVAYVDAQRVRDPLAASVRVMTVHQAKGLEFDIVVLADLESNLIGQRADLVVGRPSRTAPIDRVCRRCGKDIAQLLPDSWQRLFREADEQDLAESLCVLYVAVTRAVHALHMIVAPSADSERSLHKTFGGLLRAALTDGGKLSSAQIAYEHGDPTWFANPGGERQPTPAAVAVQAESRPPLQVRLAPPAQQRTRGLERVSPSGLEGGTHVRLPTAGSDAGESRAVALERGTLIHAWFEQILWLDDGVPGEDRLRQIANEVLEAAFSGDQLERLLADFRAMLARPAVAACLSRTAYADFAGATLQVHNERAIAVRQQDRLLSGNIDRLVTIFRNDQPIAAEIIDFKTDTLNAAGGKQVTEKVVFYRPQIEAYRSAIAKIFRLDEKQITAKLVFVSTGTVETV